MTKKCIICGKEFKPRNSKHLCCSKECSKQRENDLGKNIRKEYNKQWRQRNKEHIKKYNRQYKIKNRDKINLRRREYEKIKYNSNLKWKLKDLCRKYLKRCLNSQNTKHTFDILGYTPEQLKQRLEMNFKPDMTWENHGTLWHIDHIKPLCKFNFVLPDGTPNYEQIRLANSLANLQPLYITENLSKGGK